MANDRKYLSAEEEAKLLKPIDEYIGKIQKKIDALRVDGSDKVQALKTHIALTKEDKNYTKEEQAQIIRQDQEELVKAKAVEAANKEEVSRLILLPILIRIITKRLQKAVKPKRKRKMRNMRRFADSLRQSMSVRFPD